ncbi:adenylate/guanylate cyclase domain-containing protein [Nitrincola alkalilacustris]|uniref:adenylate/guanylate cyclase domain-containing protein n=1 Tax=Nitrincola alkalilacustris TaxID=1571224 RepID=UPI00124EFE29|nr:adenylate/guanylate cyclase domain-containing protein [Nitrincola alkalilacustris]
MNQAFLKSVPLRALLVMAIACLMAALLWFSGVLERWEARSWDMRVSWLAEPVPESDQIALILLDQPSLDWASQESGLGWPWPRELYAITSDFVARSGARALIYDVLFIEPSVYGVSDDERLAQALSGQPSLIALFASEGGAGATPVWPDELPISGFTLSDTNMLSDAWWPQVDSMTLPLDELASSTAGLGNVRNQPDIDSIYRRMRPFELFHDRPVPSLALAAYLLANPDMEVMATPDLLQLGQKQIPLDENGRALLRFRGPSGTHTAYSAAAILQSELRLRAGEEPVIAPEELSGKYVFFGFSAPGLFDLRPTPVGGVYPGVEIQATFLDNLLADDFMQMVPDWLTGLLSLLLAFFSALMLIRFSSALASALAGALLILLPIPLAVAAYELGYWLPVLWLEVSTLLAVLVCLLLNYAVEGRQKRFIRNAFQHYLSPGVIEQLVNQPDRLRLGGERKMLSIFFSDLEGFTSISEKLEPDQLTELLNDYLSAMTEIIQEEGGTVDKYEGDAIIAFWNAPMDLPNHALHAARAAVRCQQKLDELRPRYSEWTGHELFMRIGLHTGQAVVGNLGSKTRFDYTMLGDAVNLAARLEGVNKVFCSGTLLSHVIRAEVGDALALREIGCVAVMGRREPVTLFQPLPEHLDDEHHTHFETSLNRFYQGEFEEAARCFLALAQRDAVAASYLRYCIHLIKQPPDDWQGVWVLESK